jgi:osmotically inducible protein OsmC
MSSSPRILAKTLYTATATAIAGRDGKVTSDDETLQLGLSTPKGLGGPGGPGTNPEQLFAAGYAACFGSAIGHLARLQKVETGPVEVTAKVSIGPTQGVFGLAVSLTARLPSLPREQAELLVKAAHEVCPYSNATRGNIVVDVAVA